MNDLSNNKTIDRERRPTRFAARFGYWFRAVLACTTVLATAYVAYGYVRLFSEWSQSEPSAETSTLPAAELLPPAAALPLDGPWVFADINWQLRSSVRPLDDVIARMKTAETLPAEICEYPAVSPEILQLIDSLHLQPEIRGDCELYRIDRATLKAQLLVQKRGNRKQTVSFLAAYPCNDKKWQLFELAPQIGSHTLGQNDHLLPLPPNAERRGGRFADDGQLLLELLSLNCSAESLLGRWKNAGWDVRPSGLAANGGFSYLCRRNNDVIYAWSADSSESLRNLMLVNSPAEHRDAENQE